ncbi:hypothetical protein LSH36_8g10018 [Paralvinella palmiformis]|uniref:Uncharacterized protein n=1 Tax=Paralvinella palmiformis TaxID=53620 RepID=A0AAD9KEG1_9ANNE|nr:hypothetical protein LSH36_8g10018 [Paralvinella palmiformis]
MSLFACFSLSSTVQYYKELIEKASNYNSRLSAERKLRLPFLDSQTGVAQNHSNLWHPYICRGPGHRGGQIYSYPAKRWKKRKRSFPLPEVRLTKLSEMETGEADMHQISAVENPAVVVKEDSRDQYEEPYKESYQYQYYDDWENLSEPLDAGEIEARHSDSSDFEETYIRKKKKKTKHKGGRGRKKDLDKSVDDSDKPYACEPSDALFAECGARYKTRPGLSYHVSHSHTNSKKKEGQHRDHTPQREQRPRESSRDYQPQVLHYDEEPSSPSLDDSFSNGKTRSTVKTATTPQVTPAPVTPTVSNQSEVSKYCDFCLGDATENKKTGQKEDLVSCADCGRSGHPSCLQFTPNMIISVKKYPWQCIECKSCGLCGTSDNDDQLLFCDDCDRGYHMYCLKPPLSEPPEEEGAQQSGINCGERVSYSLKLVHGSWSCHLCIEEFYGGKKPDNGDATHL